MFRIVHLFGPDPGTTLANDNPILTRRMIMSHKGKVQLTIIFTATPDIVEEGDRIFKSHAKWMEKSHSREGDKALLSYNIVKGPELSNPLDPSSKPTGNTNFVLTEVYEGQVGVAEHWKQAATWEDFPSIGNWAGKCKVTTSHGAPVVHSLW
jgi:hypothetical protein